MAKKAHNMKAGQPEMALIPTWVWIVIGLALAYGIYRAVTMAWVCDDAFISFRYAKNLINGHGLVFNIGERVEGYTNFLWTMLVALGMLLGAEPILWSQIFSILSFILAGAAFVYLSLRIYRSDPSGRTVFLPLAAAGLWLHHDFQVYATSGMETAFVTALTSIGFILLTLAQRKQHFFLAGLLLILSAMTRPDAMIFYMVAVLYLLLLPGRKWKNLFFYIVPMVALYLPYWLARYNYYGYPFPNTYYAKSTYLPYYSQGLIYLWLFVKTYYILLLWPAVVVASIVILAARLWRRNTIDSISDRGLLLSVLFSVAFALYIVRIGGDFMFARLLIPALPFMLFILEAMLVKWLRRPSLSYSLAGLILVAIILRWNQFIPPNAEISGIVDERVHYPVQMIAEAKADGEELKKCLTGRNVTVGFSGARAMLIYYSELPVAIECNTGLTDAYIAHLPLKTRGRPGHEKLAPPEYLQQREVNFTFTRTTPLKTPYDSLRFIKFSNLTTRIFRYDRGLMDELKAFPEIQFTDFPEYFDNYIARGIPMTSDGFQRDVNFFLQYYFAYNPDPERLAKLESFLRPQQSPISP